MRLRIGNFYFSVDKFRPQEGQIFLNDLKDLNNEYISYLKKLEPADLAVRIESFSLSKNEFANNQDKAKSILDEFGIIVIEDLLPKEYITDFQKKITDTIGTYLNKLEDGIYEDSQVLVQGDKKKVFGYQKMAEYGKPVIEIRQGQDQGMIDCFNVSELLGIEAKPLNNMFSSPTIYGLFSKRGGVTPKNMNVYINKGITRTRGFHVDSYSPQLKAFIYLTDVLDLDDGPYTYIKGSHNSSPYSRLNRSLSHFLPNRTEAPIVPLSMICPILARKGSLIISDQAGFHRGFPQSENGERAAITMNYTN